MYLFIYNPTNEITVFQCLSKQVKNDAVKFNFTNVDQMLVNLGVSENDRNIVYKTLSAILHLGNIEFKSTDTSEITDSTKKHVNIAANLLKILPEELEKAILFRTIDVARSIIL